MIIVVNTRSEVVNTRSEGYLTFRWRRWLYWTGGQPICSSSGYFTWLGKY